ncbi:HD-GYP domain-containing protein [Paenibacillus mucilaginosus]|uniref:Metal dependent phosphohydrolase n=1 Tax=Paenibacillus mucilaginosus (strain KNP414) TaxID=1036673 RepID=F8FH14_PAEMK|nr:HD-GYP domain-containing protein [Paenibacillus mucilaginosus]AEI38664.1 metal dependent phosphohydrolase [Paenibacillus mucilaginosus KNP414]MCG7213427.1 HD-GYP domain-containing protein [Paenibacillus mucilaginosus]WDM27754.1 HD-GYP domain-containing protein [Paenibacillus mucilaginosus]
MASVPVSQLKFGDRISDNVVTKRNQVLFPKGRVISGRDVEILQAFLISSVEIESKNGSRETAAESPVPSDVPEPVKSTFQEQYDKMLRLLKQVFDAVGPGGQAPPILEIRTALEGLIRRIDQYNVLTFSPKVFQLTDYMYHNSIMVGLTSFQLARWHGCAPKDLIPIALAGLLHDIGNAKLDTSILFKPDALTSAELEGMKKHTILGYNILKGVAAINEGVKLCALQHHEREDGTGYPLGISGDKIHSYAKIVAVTDMFHAMTSDRFHKKAKSRYLVLEELLQESFGKLDPAIVQTFIQKVTSFHNGTLVKLSDGRTGEIVFSDRANPTRPWVNVNGAIINLTVERSLYILDVLPQ